MQQIRLVCVGRLKEKFYIDAAGEYIKRLSPYCKLEISEIPESRVAANPSPAEIDAALKAESAAIEARLLKNATMVALCVEGGQMDSTAFARRLGELAGSGVSRLAFVIGGSFGLHDDIKHKAAIKLSLSPMTFPHHLARIILLEQIYRGFKILEGGKYHK